MVRDRTTAFFVGSLVAFIAMGSVLSLYHSSGASGGTLTWQAYTNEEMGFALHYPADYSVDEAYSYEIAPGRVARGVSFIVPQIWSEGTNLASDTRVSVESIPELSSCNVAQYLYNTPTQNLSFVDEGLEYSFGSEVGAAAGNRYEETVFMRSDRGPCIAIRYFIHTTNIENYEEGAVVEFDAQALIQEFDTIRRSIVRI